VSGEHEQSGSAKGHVMIRGNDRTSEPCAWGTNRRETGVPEGAQQPQCIESEDLEGEQP